MSYQVTIRNSTRNQTKIWFIGSSAALIFLLSTAGSFFEIAPEFSNTVSLAIVVVASIAAVSAIFFRKRDVFLKIEEHQIEYYDFAENQLRAIPVADILSVTTRFGELHVSTASQTHCIDMTVIRDEKTRWEIKEIIKAMAPAEFRSLNMAG